MSVGQMIIVKTLRAKLDRKPIHQPTPPKKKNLNTTEIFLLSSKSIETNIYIYQHWQEYPTD